MLVSGALTCTMAYAAIAPQAALLSTFGETLQGPVAEIVVRNWGVLITLMGAMLIYGAFNPPVRSFALAVAGVSKLAFIALVLSPAAVFSAIRPALPLPSIWYGSSFSPAICSRNARQHRPRSGSSRVREIHRPPDCRTS